jgi:hypothetical protein
VAPTDAARRPSAHAWGEVIEMSELSFVIYVIAHGLMHGIVFLFPSGSSSPFDPYSSWLLEPLGLSAMGLKIVAMSLAVAAGVVFLGTGVNYFASGVVKTRSTVLASVISLVLLVVFFSPWLMVGVLIDLGFIYAVTRNDPMVLAP